MSVVLLLLGVNGLNRAGWICFCFWAIGQRWLIALRILEFDIVGPIENKATDIPPSARAMCAAKRLVRALVSTSPNGIMLQVMPEIPIPHPEIERPPKIRGGLSISGWGIGFSQAVGAGSLFSIIIWSRMRCSAIVWLQISLVAKK